MSGHTDSVNEEFSLVECYKKNGIAWGAADLFLVGRTEAITAFGQFAAILRMLIRDERPLVREIIIISPPNEDHANAISKIKAEFAKSWTDIQGTQLTNEQLGVLFSVVKYVNPKNLQSSTIIELILNAKPNTALIVWQAAIYRTHDIRTTSHETVLPEDVWVPHLSFLVDRIVTASRAKECYVIIDAGEFSPIRSENYNLLCSVDNCGVYCAANPGVSALELASRGERWHERVLAGELGAVLAEIEAMNNISMQQKTLLSLKMYDVGGFCNHAKTILEADPALITDLPPNAALQMAILAEKVDADEIAVSLLAESLPALYEQEQLETALLLADRLQNAKLITVCEDTLATLFPTSKILLSRAVTVLASKHRFIEASDLLLEHGSYEELETAEFFKLLAQHLRQDQATDFKKLMREVKERFPHRNAEAKRACAKQLETEGRRRQAVEVLLECELPEQPLDLPTTWAMLDMVERGRLLFDPTIDDGLVAVIIKRIVGTLSRQPTNGRLRLRLSNMMSPQMLGARATLAMALEVLRLARREVTIIDRPPIDQRAGSCSIEALQVIMKRGFEWLKQEQVVVLGQRIFPTELLDVPADEAIAGFEHMIEHFGTQLNDEIDLRALENCLVLASCIAPLGSEPGKDLVVLRMAAIRLALSDHKQRARDLAEQALTVAGDDPHRQRLAWFAFADIYAHVGNINESLVGLASALAAHHEATWDQIWHESLLIFRLFRDLGLIAHARPLLLPAREALKHLGLGDHFNHRLETVEFQIRLFEYEREKVPDSAHFLMLIEDVARNLQHVLDIHDEPVPAAMLLSTLLGRAEAKSIAPPARASTLLNLALERVGPRLRVLIETVGAFQPKVEQVIALAGQMEEARYAEDVGLDVRPLVIAGRRLLGSEAARDPKVAIYAIEILADQAITLPASSAQDDDGKRLIAFAGGPADVACEISLQGLAVVTLGIVDARLTRVVAVDGTPQPTVIEPTDVFSSSRLEAWEKIYPYGYGVTRDYNIFYTSTDGLGVSDLPDRAVVIAGTDLQGLPPNLLRIGQDLAGRDRRLASAPSLTWLRAVRNNIFTGDGRITAWIPDTEPEEGLPTLAIIAERLNECFAQHGVHLTNGPKPPEGLAGSDLFIVAAHGGVAEDNRYFRIVKDDANLAIKSSTLSETLANIGTVVLFVCSGGRIDKHPGASATVGLVKQLLNKGCRTVIASPWPLSASVPPYWLPAFLHAWDAGAPAIDACFEANIVVRSRLGDDPVNYLAMTIYGDPLIKKTAA